MFFRRAGSRFGISADLMPKKLIPKGETQAEIGTG